ncbi:MAG TPA: type II toxin-antitoxin system HicB family antitoxin [Chloroflexota bacterium]|jgi:antitoxin HicB
MMIAEPMTRTDAASIARYMALPYRVELIPDPEGWFVHIPELPGCMSQGDTAEEAIAMIRDAQRSWLESALANGDPVPVPSAPVHSFTGKFNVRVPKDLHRNLVARAEAEGVSLNLFVATALARVVSGPTQR